MAPTSTATIVQPSKIVHTVASNESAVSARQRLALTTSAALHRWLGADLAIVDVEAGEVLRQPVGQPAIDWTVRMPVMAEAARQGRAAFVEEEDPVVVLSLPLVADGRQLLMAVGPFLTRGVSEVADVTRAAEVLNVDSAALLSWARRQKVWSPETLEQVADLTLAKLAADARIEQLEHEADSLASKISSTFEEISLIYRLTHNLKISSNREELGQLAIHWLAEALPAEGVAIVYAADPRAGRMPPSDDTAAGRVLRKGTCLLGYDEFRALIDYVGADTSTRPVVVNQAVTGESTWPFSGVRQAVVSRLADGEYTYGWLAALNQRDGGEFGTSEASLIGSVAEILGIHSSNLELYRRQGELFTETVRAMSSAIDAKDPYTHGHSDRVARVSVRLAQALGCDLATVRTLYLSGLLHDIGKIGIDDNVLRKPGKLTEAEYEHVKTHVEIGYRILKDLPGMEPMLPVVLHHHESWDGSGYPYGLSGQNIPYLARICAVADAYDAMASDRPYRAGMPDDKLDAIIRDGAGKQWDPDVVAAFFRVRDDIRRISREQKTHGAHTPLQWT